jgi:hypothetical protein
MFLMFVLDAHTIETLWTIQVGITREVVLELDSSCGQQYISLRNFQSYKVSQVAARCV